VIPLDTRPAAASAMDADGVRTRRVTDARVRPGRWIVPALALGAVFGALALLATKERSTAPATSGAPDAAVTIATDRRSGTAAPQTTASEAATTVRRPRFVPTAATQAPDLDFTLPSTDPDDLASHFRPGDPEPTMAELIEALRDSGAREGIAAFNPPGTSPMLGGIAVPPDFELPPGYVRHHQVTDQGVDVEPILMFAPDVQFFDEQGRPIAIPDNRVVPPELAPPGLPIRPVDLPSEDGP
jgi:hypothetical protein